MALMEFKENPPEAKWRLEHVDGDKFTLSDFNYDLSSIEELFKLLKWFLILINKNDLRKNILNLYPVKSIIIVKPCPKQKLCYKKH